MLPTTLIKNFVFKAIGHLTKKAESAARDFIGNQLGCNSTEREPKKLYWALDEKGKFLDGNKFHEVVTQPHLHETVAPELGDTGQFFKEIKDVAKKVTDKAKTVAKDAAKKVVEVVKKVANAVADVLGVEKKLMELLEGVFSVV